MALVTEAYVKTHHTDHDTAHAARVVEMIASAEAWAAIEIGQVLERSTGNVSMRFDGDGRTSVVVPYNLNVAVESVTRYDYIGDAGTAVASPVIAGHELRAAEGFAAGCEYVALLTNGFAAAIGDAPSADLVGKYAAVRQVICEHVTAAFLASPWSNSGQRRFALVSMAESVQGATTRSFQFADMVPRWRAMLAPFRVYGVA